MATLFFIIVVASCYLVLQYLKWITRVSVIANEHDVKIGLQGSIGGRASTYALLSDATFLVYLVGAKYRESTNLPGLIHALDKARKYLLLQIPLAFFAFLLLPLLSIAT